MDLHIWKTNVEDKRWWCEKRTILIIEDANCKLSLQRIVGKTNDFVHWKHIYDSVYLIENTTKGENEIGPYRKRGQIRKCVNKVNIEIYIYT